MTSGRVPSPPPDPTLQVCPFSPVSSVQSRRGQGGDDNDETLRFFTCGGIDDGKSTLIARLLYETKSSREDRTDEEIGFPEFLDKLTTESKQGIAADAAYQFFTAKRQFIAADTPGHDHNTKNLVSAASSADVAVVLVDARKGVLTQTRRLSYLISLLGIRKVVLAVNKLDLIGYSGERFFEIEKDYRGFANRIGLKDVTCVPLSALKGDNVTAPSDHTACYHGPTLMAYLETTAVEDLARIGPFRMPVQWVNGPNADVRGFSGRVVGGSVRLGDRVRVLPSRAESTVTAIISKDRNLESALAGQSIMVTLADEVDISRGEVLSHVDSPPDIADQFEATIIWMSHDDMLPGRPYLLKIGARTVGVTMATPKYRLNVDTLERLAAKTLRLDDIGVCNLRLDEPIVFDTYKENREMGGFILIDRRSSDTIGAGVLHFALRRSQNVRWQPLAVDKGAHASLKGHKPCVVWFTGLSGSGKSTIANALEKQLHGLGLHTYLLDGDNLRHGLSKDLGFTQADRVENIRRVAEVARLMVDAGLIVLVSFISPFRAERRLARELVGANEFCEVFVDTPLGVAEQRDPKGLYKKARRGELKNFTGIDSPYEYPEYPEVRIETLSQKPEQAVEAILAHLRSTGMLDPW
jgi:bifunctional enzyme CysN/CysC